MILLGSSSSRVFTEQQQFIYSLLDKIEISQDSTLVGAVLYGYPPQVKWRIGDRLTKEGTKQSVSALKNPKINSDLYQALKLIDATFLNTVVGARPHAQKKILMFVGDHPIGEQSRMEALAKSLKDRKVKLVIVATGRNESKPPLDAFAYDPYSSFAPETLKNPKKMLEPVSTALQSGLIFVHLYMKYYWSL